MAALQDNKSLEITPSISEQASQNPNASMFPTGTSDPPISGVDDESIKSSTAIMAHPKDSSGSRVPQRIRHCSGQVGSLPEPPNAPPVDANPNAAPVDAGGQQIDYEVEQPPNQPPNQPVNVQVGQPRVNCCGAFYASYTDCVMKFRNSAFIYLLQFLILSLPVSAVAMGFVYKEDCPKAQYLPKLGVGIGMVGLLFMGVWTRISRRNRRGTACSAKQKFAFVVFCVSLTLASVVDAVLVYCLVPSSDPASKDYCNETFYTYTRYKEVATAIVVVFSMLLYIPGMRHTVCCENCALGHSGRYYAL